MSKQKIMLAINEERVESSIKNKAGDRFLFTEVVTRRGLLIPYVKQYRPDILIVREKLIGELNERLENILFDIRAEFPETRIVLIYPVEADKIEDISPFIQMGIYDIWIRSEIAISDIFNLVENPQTFASWAKRLQKREITEEGVVFNRVIEDNKTVLTEEAQPSAMSKDNNSNNGTFNINDKNTGSFSVEVESKKINTTEKRAVPTFVQNNGFQIGRVTKHKTKEITPTPIKTEDDISFDLTEKDNDFKQPVVNNIPKETTPPSAMNEVKKEVVKPKPIKNMFEQKKEPVPTNKDILGMKKEDAFKVLETPKGNISEDIVVGGTSPVKPLETLKSNKTFDNISNEDLNASKAFKEVNRGKIIEPITKAPLEETSKEPAVKSEQIKEEINEVKTPTVETKHGGLISKTSASATQTTLQTSTKTKGSSLEGRRILNPKEIQSQLASKKAGKVATAKVSELKAVKPEVTQPNVQPIKTDISVVMPTQKEQVTDKGSSSERMLDRKGILTTAEIAKHKTAEKPTVSESTKKEPLLTKDSKENVSNLVLPPVDKDKEPQVLLFMNAVDMSLSQTALSIAILLAQHGHQVAYIEDNHKTATSYFLKEIKTVSLYSKYIVADCVLDTEEKVSNLALLKTTNKTKLFDLVRDIKREKEAQYIIVSTNFESKNEDLLLYSQKQFLTMVQNPLTVNYLKNNYLYKLQKSAIIVLLEEYGSLKMSDIEVLNELKVDKVMKIEDKHIINYNSLKERTPWVLIEKKKIDVYADLVKLI